MDDTKFNPVNWKACTTGCGIALIDHGEGILTGSYKTELAARQAWDGATDTVVARLDLLVLYIRHVREEAQTRLIPTSSTNFQVHRIFRHYEANRRHVNNYVRGCLRLLVEEFPLIASQYRDFLTSYVFPEGGIEIEVVQLKDDTQHEKDREALARVAAYLEAGTGAGYTELTISAEHALLIAALIREVQQ